MGGVGMMQAAATQADIRARIGMVNFINTAPLFEVWRRTVTRTDWAVTEAPPTTLNTMLFRDELDLGFVSSHEYAVHPGQYKILSDLSISATGAVGSVFLFSRLAPKQLADKRILMSSHSQTSVSLVKIILEKFYGVAPQYQPGMVEDLEQDRGRFDAVLAIGDNALRLAGRDDYPIRLDLSEEWYRQTGLPFVFAVWAVREDFCRRDPDCVVEIHQELQRCVKEGKNDLINISRSVAPRIPMTPESCYDYLRRVEYDLGTEKQKALNCFFEYLIERGEGAPEAIPLKICG